MRVFITGASGFIGTAVTKELLQAGHTVLALARSDAAAEALTALGVDIQRGSIYDLEALKEGAATCDGVIHIAFVQDLTNYAQSCQTDREAIRAMADVLTGSNRPLIVTSGTLSLPLGRLATENDPHDASSIFAIRGQSELLALSLASQGIRSSVMRLAPTNHGDNDCHGFLPILIAKAREKGVSVYIGDGLNRWPAVHYLDTAVAYRLALEKGIAGSIFHSIAEEGVQMKDIATVIGRKLGVPVESMSFAKAKEHFGFLASLVSYDNPTSSKQTREVLGWNPRQCTLLADLEGGRYFDCQDSEDFAKMWEG